MKFILLISHGSRLEETRQEVEVLMKKLQAKTPGFTYEYAFLDVQKPTISEGIDLCVQKGAEEIIILLNFLNAGSHVNHDIPEIVETAKKKYPEVTFKITAPVGQHEGMLVLFEDLIRNANQTIKLVSRGTKDEGRGTKIMTTVIIRLSSIVSRLS